jgi:cation transport ATPase
MNFLGCSHSLHTFFLTSFLDSGLFFDTSAMIVTFILLGRFLEAGSRLKAGNAIVALAGLQPQEALLVKENGQRETITLDRVSPESIIEIIPGAKIPLDGTVIEGEAEINESMLTGESLPVMKGPGSSIFAGTVNANLLGPVTINDTAAVFGDRGDLEHAHRDLLAPGRQRHRGVVDPVTGLGQGLEGIMDLAFANEYSDHVLVVI